MSINNEQNYMKHPMYLNLSFFFFFVLLPQLSLAGSICEGSACTMIFIRMMLFTYGWIIGLLIILGTVITTYFLWKKKKKISCFYAIPIIIGIFFVYQTAIVHIEEGISIMGSKQRTSENIRNLPFDVFVPSQLPENTHVSQIMIVDNTMTINIKKIKYDSNLPGNQVFWGTLYERSSQNSNVASCWTADLYIKENAYSRCAKSETLNDGTVVYWVDQTKFYFKKVNTDILLETGIGLASSETITDNRPDILHVIESLDIADKIDLIEQVQNQK